MSRRDLRWRTIRAWSAKAWLALQAGDGVRRGVTWSAAVIVGVVAILIGSTMPIGFGPVLDLIAGSLLYLLVAALIAAAAAASARLLWLISRAVSWRTFLVLAGGIGAVILLSMLDLLVILPLAIPALLLGGALGAWLDGTWADRSWWSRTAIVGTALAACVALVLVTASFVDRGSSDHLAKIPDDPAPVEALAVEDPSQPGPYLARALTYGSGTGSRRDDPGVDPFLSTEPVDGSAFVKGSTAWRMRLRTWYWGFDETAMPINGSVWYPEGDGPFPLVLIVHGNHSMEERSDPGYAWLGELLASRGFILVSVDENFLKGSFRGSPSRENDARAWILLQHLRVWQTWSKQPGNPFAGKVDMDRIALIGHSRGGEAVAIAASFNRLPRYPDDATIELPHGFGIRSVVAIAPCDGQYEPMGRPTQLQGVSYLTLQGGHDADVSVFMGARQWRRAQLDPGQLKLSVWAYRANHGQFNTVWGDTDISWPLSWLLNREPLLPGEAQRSVAAVTISAFLELTLHDRDAYRPMLHDLRTAARWLPDDLLITRVQEASFTALADFEGDIDATTGAPGVSLAGNGLEVWREEQQAFRKWGSKRNGVAVLGWRADTTDTTDDEPEPPAYELHLDQDVRTRLAPSLETVLVLSLADTGDKPPLDEDLDEDAAEDTKDEEPDEEPDDDTVLTPLDLSIELEDAEGTRIRLPLSSFRQLPPPVHSRMTKLPFESRLYGEAWESTLQTFELPLARFIDQQPAFDPSALEAIRLVFDRSDEGMIMVDDIGLDEPAGAAGPR